MTRKCCQIDPNLARSITDFEWPVSGDSQVSKGQPHRTHCKARFSGHLGLTSGRVSTKRISKAQDIQVLPGCNSPNLAHKASDPRF